MTDPLADDQLAEIEARAASATPGPWKLDNMHCYFFAPDGMVFDLDEPLRTYSDASPETQDELERRVLALRLRGHGAEVSGHRPKGSQMANARFVEHARADVPALAAEIRRQRADLTRTRAERDAALAELERLRGGGDAG